MTTYQIAKAIPVYPQGITVGGIARKLGGASNGCLLDRFTSAFLLCEDDDGRVSWLTEEAKDEGLRFFKDGPGTRAKAVRAWKDGELYGLYPSSQKAAEAVGLSEPSVSKGASKGVGIRGGWRFEYV